MRNRSIVKMDVQEGNKTNFNKKENVAIMNIINQRRK